MRHQQIFRKRLPQEYHRPEFGNHIPDLRVGLPGNHNDAGWVLELLKPPHDLHATQSWQPQVNDHNVLREGWWRLEKGLGIRIADCIMAHTTEERCQRIGNPIIIFDDVYGHGERNSITPDLQASQSIERSSRE